MNIAPAPMDPFHDVLNLEQNFYQTGFEHGFEQGKLAGFEDGRQLGVSKGFEIWEEVAFYEGLASLWSAHRAQSTTTDGSTRAAGAILELVARFPQSNPKHEDFDVVRLLNQIRSKYKVLCATIGTRPRLFVAANDA